MSTNIDEAITALTATDADEDTTAGLLIAAYGNANAQVTDLTAKLAAAIAANDPAKIAAQLAALQSLNTSNASTTQKMKDALAAPVVDPNP